MKKIYLFANWKMYLGLKESIALAKNIKKEFEKLPSEVEMAVFPSALAFSKVADELSGGVVKGGAQNAYWVGEGGYTGEVSAEMFANAGAKYVLVGHSERRHQFHETNHEVRQKIEAILAAGLTPVICVGETGKEREEGQTQEVVEAQLRAALNALVWPIEKELIIAYEPVWAISRGLDQPDKHCSPAEAGTVHKLIEKITTELIGKTPAVLYGGSVRHETVAEFITTPYVAGVLVGAASTKFSSWAEIVTTALNTLR